MFKGGKYLWILLLGVTFTYIFFSPYILATLFVIFSASLLGLIAAQSGALNISELCALAPNSVILRPDSCTDWLKCPSSIGASDLEEGSCVFGLYFNKNTGRCEYKEKVKCPFEATSKNRCSREAEGTFLADNEHCNAYIYCKGGEEIRSYCPNNLVFDPVNKACVYKHQYKCPEQKPKADIDPICLSLKDGVFFADKNDCSKYSRCHRGALETSNCNNSLAWSYIDHKCMSIDEAVCYPTAKKPKPELKVCIDHVGPISDGVSCSGYYFCKKVANVTHDRNPEHFTCSSGTFFDSNTLSCRDRVNVKCPLDRCEGMGNKYVNVAGDCRAYALCANSAASTQGICPSNYYFDERTQGCTPQVVSYAACSA